MKLNDLKDLAPIRSAIAQRRAEAERRAAEAARADQERRLFERTVGPVTPIASAARSVSDLPRPEPIPVQRALDERAALLETWSDEFDVETLLETDAGLSFRRRDVGPDVPRKLRRGVWVIRAEVDLHGLRRDEARERLAGFLRESRRNGLRCVRVVHGKGLGSPGRQPVLKGKVHSWLVQNAAVQAFVQARPADGGHGALVVLLAPPSRKS